MRIPYTVNQNTIECYRLPKNVFKHRGLLHSEDFSILNGKVPPRLQQMCIEVIANNWAVNPIYKDIPLLPDRLLLLDLLPVDLPLELTVKNIYEDVYWKKCYYSKWPKLLPKDPPAENSFPATVSQSSSGTSSSVEIIATNGNNRQYKSKEINSSLEIVESEQNKNRKTWKHYYLEMHLKEFLENLRPEEFGCEKVKSLNDLCGKYIHTLNLRELQAPQKGSNHIPLDGVIESLENLMELRICFKQTYVRDHFSWDIFKTSMNDIVLLSKGLESSNLKKLRLYKSDIDCEKLIAILKSLVRNENLQELDFSHNNIADKGAAALSSFAINNSSIQNIVLTDNKIGSRGATAFSYALAQPNCHLQSLSLRLNHIESSGANSILDSLCSGGKYLSHLCIAACGLKDENLLLGRMIEKNRSVIDLDISNNRFGENVGKEIQQSLHNNTTMKKLNLGMCDLSSAIKYEIRLLIERNRKLAKQKNVPPKPLVDKDEQDTSELRKLWNKDLISEIKNILT